MILILKYLGPLLAAVVAITVHEYSKALTSTVLGDKLPENNGRLTLNPLKHIDGLGLLMMYYTTFAFGTGIGFGKPTQTSAMYYKNRKTGTILTYLMPIVVNIFLGLLIALLTVFLPSNGGLVYLNDVLLMIAKCNVSLGLYSLIPIYPLDGEVVLNTATGKTRIGYSTGYKLAQYLFLFFSLFGYVTFIISPLVNLILRFAIV